MNYKNVYDKIIENAKSQNRKKNQGTYFEEHHIIARCMGGDDSKENLVLLTGREHFICHKLLHKMYPEDAKIFLGYRTMAIMNSSGQRHEIGAREFEYIREQFSKFISEINTGKVFTEEHLQKLRDNNPNIGGLTEEHKKAISDALTGRKLSPEHIAACSSGLKKLYETRPGPRLGIPHTEEAKEKNRQSTLEYWASRTPEEMKAWSEKFSGENNANFGKKRPEEFCKKMSENNSLRLVYDGIEYISSKVLCEFLGISTSTLSKKFPKLNKENPEKYYYIDPDGKRERAKQNLTPKTRRILFDGTEYESIVACSISIGKSDVRVGQILREQIKKNNQNYSYLT